MTINRYHESHTTRIFLFVSSLSPGFVIGGIRIGTWLGCSLIALGVSCLAITPFVLKARSASAIQPEFLESTAFENSQIPTYLITFVFPFLIIPADSNISLIPAYMAFAILMVILLYRSNLMLVNPALLILGFNIFSARIASEGDIYILSKYRPHPNTRIYMKRVVNGLYIIDDECIIEMENH